ncbi:MAG: DMT family transporter [Chromatiaceae bacterium]|jgi:drug/metabolite transporter (DMT)-like permease|nr:DMT family transporter [Chromatiaceae bacterium]
MDWLTLSLICAFSLASADAATKGWLRDYSARELTLVRVGLTGLLMAPLLTGLGPVWELPPAFWGWILALIPLELGAMLIYMRAIRDHALSLTLPYLAFTPVFVILTGFVLLGERVSLQGAGGILLVVAGAWLLNVRHASLRAWRTWALPLRAILWEPGSRMMLAVAFLYSLTSAMGKGAMQYMAPEHFGAFYFVLLGTAAVVLFAGPRPRLLVSIWRRPWAALAVAGLSALMVYTHFLALQQVEVAYMIAVKRTSLLFGILYGALIFKETGLGAHALAGALMLGGVFLIAFQAG